MKKIVVLSLALIICIGTGTAGYFYYQHMIETVEHDKIYEGITINNIDVGGLTKGEAMKKLGQYIKKDHENKELVLYYGDENWVLSYLDWGFKSDFSEMVEKAYAFGREGGLHERYQIVTALEKESMQYDVHYKYDEGKIDEVLTTIEKNFNRESKDAIIERKNGQFVVTEETVGYRVDKRKSREKIKDKLDNREEGRLELVVIEDIPDLRKEFLDHIQDVLGTFSTAFSNDNPNRNKNLQVAAGRMNGSLLLSGEVFSLMNAIGPVDLAHGYKNAPIILNGKLVPGVGGGICQMATTAYNAALLAELQIIERQNHSMPVAYVPLSRDAVVSGSALDLKIRNDRNFPVYIQSYVLNNKLYATIYGKETRNPNRNIKFYSVTTKTLKAPPAKITYDPNLPAGKEVFELKAIKGYKVKLMKEVSVSGEVTGHQVVNYSHYRPRAAVKKVGTKKNVAKEPVEKKEELTDFLEGTEMEIIQGGENVTQENSQEEGRQEKSREENSEKEDQNDNQESGTEN